MNAGSPETVTYLHNDHLGTPKFGTNAAGAQVWAWAPDSFGNGTPTGSATVNLRMPGQYFDAESGIFYNWNRYYNPEIGRYISSDPIGLEGGMNTFLYAGANPVMAVDPEGLYSWWDFQGDIAEGTINGLNGLAGLTDALTLGASQSYRERTGQDYVDTCSVSYGIGSWGGTGTQILAGGWKPYTSVTPMTTGGSITNWGAGISRTQFEKNLLKAGYTKATPRAGISLFTKGNKSYSIYPEATSNGFPSVQVILNGKTVSKIRLLE